MNIRIRSVRCDAPSLYFSKCGILTSSWFFDLNLLHGGDLCQQRNGNLQANQTLPVTFAMVFVQFPISWKGQSEVIMRGCFSYKLVALNLVSDKMGQLKHHPPKLDYSHQKGRWLFNNCGVILTLIIHWLGHSLFVLWFSEAMLAIWNERLAKGLYQKSTLPVVGLVIYILQIRTFYHRSYPSPCVEPLREDWAIFCRAGSGRVGIVWSAKEKKTFNTGNLTIGPQGGQTVNSFSFLLSYRGMKLGLPATVRRHVANKLPESIKPCSCMIISTHSIG